jgi:hypothetical protein
MVNCEWLNENCEGENHYDKKICFCVAGYQTVLIPVKGKERIYSEQTIAAMWNIHWCYG